MRNKLFLKLTAFGLSALLFVTSGMSVYAGDLGGGNDISDGDLNALLDMINSQDQAAPEGGAGNNGSDIGNLVEDTDDPIQDLPSQQDSGVIRDEDPQGPQDERQREEERRRQEEARRRQDEEDRKNNPDPEDYDYAGKYGYKLQISKSKLSFGTVSRDDRSMTQRITITNVGKTGVTLNWTLTDPDNVFSVDANNVTRISARGSAMIYITADVSNSKEGTHSATLLLGDGGDPGFKWGSTVTLGVKVKEEEHRISGITLNPGNVNVTPGSVIFYHADIRGDGDPDSDINWKIEGNSDDDTYINEKGELTIGENEETGSIRVIASYKEDKSVYDDAFAKVENNRISVVVSADPGEGGYVSGNTTIKSKGTAKIIATPNNGWRFKHWVINDEVVEEGSTLTLRDITRNTNVVAKFTRGSVYIKVRSDNTDYGTVDGGGEVAPGSSMTIKAQARSGYRFSYWERDGEKYSTDQTLQLKDIQKDRKYVAFFEKEKYTVSAVIAPAGAGAADGVGEYKKGSEATLKAKANPGYEFKAWMKDGKVLSTSDTITIYDINRDQNITAAFSAKSGKMVLWNVEAATTTTNGVITPAGITRIPNEGGLTFTITPKAGYGISAVVVDGTNIGPVASYTFKNVTSDHAIVASFAPLPGNNNPAPAPKPTPAPAPNQGGQAGGGQSQTGQGSNKGQDTQAKQPQGGQSQNAQADDSSPIKASDPKYDEYVVEDEEVSTQGGAPNAAMEELTSLYGPMQQLDILPGQALDMIRNGEDGMLLEAALADDDISIIVNNAYSDNPQETSGGNLSVEDPTIRNFMEIVDAILTEEDKMSAYKGDRVSFSLNIMEANNFVEDGEKALMARMIPADTHVADYFTVNLMKIVKGDVSNLDRLSGEMEIRIKIPEAMRGSGDFAVVREHEGTVTVLPDLDDDPDTITFRTDRFSMYGILKEGKASIIADSITAKEKSGLIFVVCAAVTAVIIIILTAAILGTRRRRKR